MRSPQADPPTLRGSGEHCSSTIKVENSWGLPNQLGHLRPVSPLRIGPRPFWRSGQNGPGLRAHHQHEQTTQGLCTVTTLEPALGPTPE